MTTTTDYLCTTTEVKRNLYLLTINSFELFVLNSRRPQSYIRNLNSRNENILTIETGGVNTIFKNKANFTNLIATFYF